ncbi:cytochrome c oxidase subunit 3 [Sphingobacterium psychroaquaticum]|uniref:cytochrome-c oxidase n=1 Tax=Sphingobacterium psychroaquaticum TaxID=561061 RepID=A0A1X7K2F5_9SPHI|nr:cytochrome c oxidase subunit 3 [Sphingobacterium psychroaquaticum]QBQ42451.1 heme-copper oxidase subunit III [Sphingobacterium psychroaquaticum]SMG34305.1 cytochrome c oxidase subunit 3 [Sphingobacterium psychroaquaticum]
MENTEQVVEEVIQSRKAKKFNLWLGMIGMFMMFAALSSGFIVYTASGVDKGIKTLLPNAFIYSTITILLSSVTLYLAHNAAKKQRLGQQKNFLILTLLLGLVFFGLQVHSWTVLAGQGIFFVNPNASQSFIYIFTGLHLAHIIAGLIVLIRCLMGAMKPIPHADNLFRMDLASIFWHFLDLLWIYIYVFLLLNQ